MRGPLLLGRDSGGPSSSGTCISSALKVLPERGVVAAKDCCLVLSVPRSYWLSLPLGSRPVPMAPLQSCCTALLRSITAGSDRNVVGDGWECLDGEVNRLVRCDRGGLVVVLMLLIQVSMPSREGMLVGRMEVVVRAVRAGARGCRGVEASPAEANSTAGGWGTKVVV